MLGWEIIQALSVSNLGFFFNGAFQNADIKPILLSILLPLIHLEMELLSFLLLTLNK